MSDEKSSKKKSRRPRGAFALWIFVAVLALVYLGVWSADRSTGKLPQSPGSVSAEPASLSNDTTAALGDAAKQDAAGRAPGTEVVVATVEPTFFTPGSQLKKSVPGVGQLGATVTLKATKDGKVTDTFTYYALPPNQVEFVSQKPVN